MARSVIIIYNEMITEKETFSSLNGLLPKPETAATLLAALTSSSKVAVWRLYFWVVAFCIHIHEVLWDAFKTDIETILANKEPGTLQWMVDKCYDFQYGDNLTWINNQFQYAVLDETKQIIKVAAGIETNGLVVLKVAKSSGTDYVKLSELELAAFQTYIGQIKYAGVRVTVISEDPDTLLLEYNVYYNPLILKDDGSLITDGAVFPAKTALENYIKNLPFDGVLNLTQLTYALKQATGVEDCVLTKAQAKYGSYAFADINRQYVSYSGYLTNESGYPLITYISNE